MQPNSAPKSGANQGTLDLRGIGDRELFIQNNRLAIVPIEDAEAFGEYLVTARAAVVVDLRKERGKRRITLMNEAQLEQIINHQRLQLLHLHNNWLDCWERNLDLRQHILNLEDLLDQAGIEYRPLPVPAEHPEFNFAVEVES